MGFAGFPSALVSRLGWNPPESLRGACRDRRAQRRPLPGLTAGRVAVVLLVAFHAWLFGDHIFDGRLVDPVVACRWVAGGLLTLGFLWLRRLGLPVLRGRKAIVLWLLVVLLHVHAAWAPGTGASGWAGARDAVATCALQAVSAGVLAVGLALLGLLTGALPTAARARRWVPIEVRSVRTAAALHLACLCPRPPPCA